MGGQDDSLINKRRAEFDDFYRNLIPTLVDFVDKMGIQPSHEVLREAVRYAPYLGRALEQMPVIDEQDRTWLLLRVAYFVGEYFAQRYGGHWYVNDLPGSRYFGRYVVGQFSEAGARELMIDPFEVAKAYVDTPPPRGLEKLLDEVESELRAGSEARR